MDEETDIELGMEEEDIYDEVEIWSSLSCGCSVFEGLKTVSSDVIILTCVNCGMFILSLVVILNCIVSRWLRTNSKLD
jgi:hypothetical protein